MTEPLERIAETLEEKVDSHEKRIIRLEVCQESMVKSIEDLRTYMVSGLGRVEKGIEQLRRDIREDNRARSEQDIQLAEVRAKITLGFGIAAVIMGPVIAYFLGR